MLFSWGAAHAVFRQCGAILKRCCYKESRHYSAIYFTSRMAESSPLVVFVRNVASEEDMSVCLYINGKLRNMKRSKSESLKKTLHRIWLSYSEKRTEGKKKKQKMHVVPNNTMIKVTCGGANVNDETSNSDAWVEQNSLLIGSVEYIITVNPPTVVNISIPPCCMAGYPVIPEYHLEFAESCQWEWFDGNEKLCSQQVFLPDDSHVGSSLTVKCIPISKDDTRGISMEVATPKIVSGPATCLSNSRYQYTPVANDPNKLRILSYNILADMYASEPYSRSVLYPYCKPDALEIAYRQCLLGKELPSYNADILCLQEVGVRCYSSYLSPLMEYHGYQGCFQRKYGQVPEGEAVFFQMSKLMLVKAFAVSLSEFLQNDSSNADFYQQLKRSQYLIDSLLTKHSLCQVVLLQPKHRNDVLLAVANTHLISHPLADHLRLIQTELCLRYFSKVIREFSVDQSKVILPIFCGDFNSCPEFAVYEYMSQGHIGCGHADWSTHKYYERRMAEKREQKEAKKNGHCLDDMEDDCLIGFPQQTAVEQRIAGCAKTADKFDNFTGVELYHKHSFINATGLPNYTNFTTGFSGTLDYIFIDKNNFTVEQVVPLPAHQDVIKHVALPSVEHPSDHLAIICDVVLNM